MHNRWRDSSRGSDKSHGERIVVRVRLNRCLNTQGCYLHSMLSNLVVHLLAFSLHSVEFTCAILNLVKIFQHPDFGLQEGGRARSSSAPFAVQKDCGVTAVRRLVVCSFA